MRMSVQALSYKFIEVRESNPTLRQAQGTECLVKEIQRLNLQAACSWQVSAKAAKAAKTGRAYFRVYTFKL
jgi:hypothetical protein